MADGGGEGREGRLLLGRPERIGGYVVGLLLTALGTVAVFTSDNEAGTVALVVAGAAIVVAAAVGRFPEEGSIGKLSWAYQTVSALLDDEDEAVRQAAAKTVSTKMPSGDPFQEDLAARARRILNERELLEETSRVLSRSLSHITLRRNVKIVPGFRTDLVIEPAPDAARQFPPIPVEVRAESRGARLQATINQTATVARAASSRRAIVVLAEGGPPSNTTVNGVEVLVVRLDDVKQDASAVRRVVDDA